MLTASTPGAPIGPDLLPRPEDQALFDIKRLPLVGFDPSVGSSPATGLASSRSDPSGPFTPTPLQGLHRYYGPVCPVPRIGTLRLRVAFPWRSPSRDQGADNTHFDWPSLSGRQVLLFHASACDELTPLLHRTPPGQPPGSLLTSATHQRARLSSRELCDSPVSMSSFAVSMRQQWFTHVRLLRRTPDRSRRPFPQRSRPQLLTAAACGGLGSPPDRRSRRAYLHHRHSTAHDNDLLHHHHSPFRTHRILGVRLSDDPLEHCSSPPSHVLPRWPVLFG